MRNTDWSSGSSVAVDLFCLIPLLAAAASATSLAANDELDGTSPLLTPPALFWVFGLGTPVGAALGNENPEAETSPQNDGPPDPRVLSTLAPKPTPPLTAPPAPNMAA